MKIIVTATKLDLSKYKYTNLVKPEMLTIGKIAVDHYRSNFDKGGFDGDRWQTVRGKAHPLVQTKRLRNSIRIQGIGSNYVMVGSRLVYAPTHNDGAILMRTEKMTKYFWAMWYKTKNPKWKYMALSKKNIVIPQRKFIGESRVLNAKIRRLIINKIKRIKR